MNRDDWRCELSSQVVDTYAGPTIVMCGKPATLRPHRASRFGIAACDGCWARWLERKEQEQREQVEE